MITIPIDPGDINADYLTEVQFNSGRTFADVVSWARDHDVSAYIRSSWARSALPLADLAPRIRNVSLVTSVTRDYIGLEVDLGSRVARLQSPPTADAVSAALAKSRLEIPAAIIELLTVAPGLSLDGEGEWLTWETIQHPLVDLRARFDSRHLSRVIDAAPCQVELVDTYQGSFYVLAERRGCLVYAIRLPVACVSLPRLRHLAVV